ncbi:MAG: biotin--[acetyl-CoA-carboxylase] ligase [Chloroflexi bacterium]|nr:biotin--[acetyl-CoA-carboxylase] ligase [Chloroflexota bacterium]
MGLWLDFSRVEERLETKYVGRNIVYYTRTGSTQDIARREGEAGAPEGTAVVADEQTAGRGRLGRSFISPPNVNLYVTLVLKPPLERLNTLSVITPLAVAEAVESVAPISARIKWPNDILVNSRKACGILIESELSGDEVSYSLVGMGVNVNMDVEAYPEIADIATSLKRELGREVSREDLLVALLNRYEALYEAVKRGKAVHEAWRSRLETLGRQVQVRFGEQLEEGLAEDVDEKGSLILRRADGSRVIIAAGDVTLRG